MELGGGSENLDSFKAPLIFFREEKDAIQEEETASKDIPSPLSTAVSVVKECMLMSKGSMKN